MISQIPFVVFITFITLSFSFFLFIKQKRKTITNSRRLPPGPKKLPVIGNLHQLGNLPHRSLQNLSKTYGDLMFLQLGSVPTLVVSSPNMAQEIFKNHDLIFSGRPPLYAVKRITYDLSDISFAPYGDHWREVRKIVVLELMTVKRVQSFANIRAEEVALMIDSIKSSGRNPVDLSSLVFSLSNNVVSRVAFGTTNCIDRDKNNRFQEILQEIQQLLGEFNLADYFPGMDWINKFNGVDNRLKKYFGDLDKFFDKVIQEHVDPRRSKSDEEDIIDVLLRIQKDPFETIKLKDEQLKGVIVDLFIAGTETSAATIVWTMTELIRNPEIKQKAQQEVRKIAKGKPEVEESDLPKLTYLKLIIKESLRLHPPTPLLLPRETTQSCTIGSKNYFIPAKTRVFFNATTISKDPRFWEDPERFWPDRFMNGEIDFRGQSFELLPFGAGRRGCPGINFAVSLVELVLANLLLRFDWGLEEGIEMKDIDMEEAVGITTHKKTPLRLVAHEVAKEEKKCL
ncbi:Cytochrome P450 CYP2 subfamily [Handroanthus impetiginosus]|uniref:Cytochrome P450 CYP2 subfamily n=1 Tax=Handroanthus impetiginosus TaxID=429701 RepID=A0A2G9HZZ9_9LAMI|nr:Cytochrome P450 CYP2 subfamily [Handroanthus impetiginosus]